MKNAMFGILSKNNIYPDGARSILFYGEDVFKKIKNLSLSYSYKIVRRL
jgi:hypothetical protein